MFSRHVKQRQVALLLLSSLFKHRLKITFIDREVNKMENLSLETNTNFPRDFLQIFTSGFGPRSDPEEDLGSGEGVEVEVELNLGLSLGGRFGVEKSNNSININNNKLVRSSSIATILPVVRDDDVLVSGHNINPGRCYSGLTRTTSLPVESEEEWRKRKELQSLRRLAAKRRRSEKQNNLTKADRKEYVAAISRQGSSGETSSPLQESSKPPSSPAGIGARKNSIGLSEEMPCVFTQGDGPNGRVVEGILYKYGKGEQVKIMCVCHGSFLSPAEFVKHAGGTDFVHPLKHIVVKPSSSF